MGCIQEPVEMTEKITYNYFNLSTKKLDVQQSFFISPVGEICK